MTETLARIYLEQKKYDNAIKAYQILILKYPEKSGFFADRFLDFSPLSTVCLGLSEVVGRQGSSQLTPRRPLAPQKQEMVIVLHCFSSPYLYPHYSLVQWIKKRRKKQMCNNIYVWKNGLWPWNTTKVWIVLLHFLKIHVGNENTCCISHALQLEEGFLGNTALHGWVIDSLHNEWIVRIWFNLLCDFKQKWAFFLQCMIVLIRLEVFTV